MKALITGGAGFIGSHLAEELLQRGHSVTCIDNLSTGTASNVGHINELPNFQFVEETLANSVVLDRLASECEVIFHLAAAVGVELIVNDPVHVIETNVLGTDSVLKAAARYRNKVLIASTSEIYGKNTTVPFSEEDDRLLGPTTRSRWSYAESKAVDEFLGLAYHHQQGLPVVIVRFFNTVGPRQTGQYGMVVPRFVEQALKGNPITVYGDGLQSRCFCNVKDVVRAMIGLVEQPSCEGEVFNIGSQEETTVLDLAKKVLHTVDEHRGESGAGTKSIDSRIKFVPYEEAYEPGFEDMRRRVPDIDKISAAIGWEPSITLAETLRQIVEYSDSEVSSNSKKNDA